jgi:hypothetical protein
MNARRTAMLLTMSVGALLGPVAAEAQRGPVPVTLQNDDLAPADVARRAQAEVTRLYGLIGVEIDWVPSSTDDADVRVVKLTTWEPRADRLRSLALGATYGKTGGPGARAYVFWLRVQRAAQQFSIGADRLLGAAIAHELGHMLLSRASHASRGLMRATWDREEFRSVGNGVLHFSPRSAAQIRGSVNTLLASSKPNPLAGRKR